MKASTLILLLLSQALFVAYGLALTFWTINEWLADERLNAIFGGFIGATFFLMAWRLIRKWARSYFRIGN